MRVGSQAAIAHELRQPVSAMLPAVALMQSRPDIKTGQAAREVIARQVGQLRRVLDDLLDLALVAEGKMTRNKQHMDVRQGVEQVTDVMTPLVAKRGQRLHVTVPQTPVLMLGDAARLQQVLSNLLTNAGRCSHEGGQVFVHVEVKNDAVDLRPR